MENDLPVNPDYVDSVMSHGAVVLTRSKWFNGVTIEADAVTYTSVLSLPFVQQITMVNRILSHAAEERIEQDKFQMPLSDDINNPLRTQLLNYGQSSTQIEIMNGDYLHDIGFHGENMLIALLDAGFYHVNMLAPFDSLRMNNQIIGTWDFVANEVGVYEDHDHGMAVLSTIGGDVEGQLIGTAPKANFWLLRTEDGATEHRIEEYNWDAGAEFADSAGADIISTSLGYSNHFTNSSEDHTYSEMNGHTTVCARAANIAFSKGMLVIASAGNSGAVNDTWKYINSPGDADSALAIGSVNGTGRRSSFSSRGPSYDRDIKPNLAAVGEGTVLSTGAGTIGSGNGTSFSCPVLAGSAACLWQAFPHKKNIEIFNAIQESASQYDHPDSLLGYGIPNFKLAYQILLGIGDPGYSTTDQLIHVFPNPSSENLSIKYYSVSDQELSIEIFDAIGKNVLQEKSSVSAKVFNTIQIPFARLGKGIYFIRVVGKESSFLEKAVKI